MGENEAWQNNFLQRWNELCLKTQLLPKQSFAVHHISEKQ